MRKINLSLVLVLTAAALLAGLWMGRGYAASTAAPGSDQDPLVTKSYVDDAIAKLAAKLEDVGLPGEDPNNPPAASIGLKVVSVAAGESLIAYEGTEFILRSGKATVIASAAGGIPDLTAGKDLPNKAAVPANHLLLFPRSDQRGLKATTNIIVMVRGEYSIEP
jgi:hypothetical protein